MLPFGKTLKTVWLTPPLCVYYLSQLDQHLFCSVTFTMLCSPMFLSPCFFCSFLESPPLPIGSASPALICMRLTLLWRENIEYFCLFVWSFFFFVLMFLERTHIGHAKFTHLILLHLCPLFTWEHDTFLFFFSVIFVVTSALIQVLLKIFGYYSKTPRASAAQTSRGSSFHHLQ